MRTTYLYIGTSKVLFLCLCVLSAFLNDYAVSDETLGELLNLGITGITET